MSYNVDELFDIADDGFGFHETAFVCDFLKRGDPSVTRVEIPAEYHGYPVKNIRQFSFSDCKYLREIFIPDSVETIDTWAFENCEELREVRLPKHVSIELQGFKNCPRLAPEVVMAGLIGNAEDISAPLNSEQWLDRDALLRPEVFELAVKYDSFRLIGTEMLFKEIVWCGLLSHFEMLEKAGRSPELEHTDRLIEFSSENGYTEMTAYLLDLKNRKFGFKGGDKFEL